MNTFGAQYWSGDHNFINLESSQWLYIQALVYILAFLVLFTTKVGIFCKTFIAQKCPKYSESLSIQQKTPQKYTEGCSLLQSFQSIYNWFTGLVTLPFFVVLSCQSTNILCRKFLFLYISPVQNYNFWFPSSPFFWNFYNVIMQASF